MKAFIVAAAVAIGAMSMTSCKKDYLCKCTVTSGSNSVTQTHELNNQTWRDADDACERYEDDANAIAPNTTTCNL